MMRVASTNCSGGVSFSRSRWPRLAVPRARLIEIESGEHEDARRVGTRSDASSCFDTVELGHADVHQYKIGIGPGDDLDRFNAIRGFTNDGDVVFGFEDHTEPGADEVLIVDHHDTNHGGNRQGGADEPAGTLPWSGIESSAAQSGAFAPAGQAETAG